MPKWGYSINKDNQIDLDKNSGKLWDELLEREKSIKACYSCGTCSATCSAGHYTNINFRKQMLLVSRGEKVDVKNELSKCMLCGKCMLLCPRGVNTRNTIMNLLKLVN